MEATKAKSAKRVRKSATAPAISPEVQEKGMIAFAERHGLKYIRCSIPRKLNGDKDTDALARQLPSGWKKMSRETLAEVNKQREGSVHVLIDLVGTPFMVVDVDNADGDPNFDDQCLPWSLSTRGKKHYWHRRKSGDTNSTKIEGGDETDYIYSHIFERANDVMGGDWSNLPEFDYERYLPAASAPAPERRTEMPKKASGSTPKPSSSHPHEAIDHCRNIDGGCITNYGDWVRFIAACANAGVPESICLEVSARAPNHNPSADPKHISRIYSESGHRAGLPTLCYMSKQSDEANFRRLQAKHFWNKESEDAIIKSPNDTAYARAYLALNKDVVGLTPAGTLCFFDERTATWSLGKKAESMIRNAVCDCLQGLLRQKIASTDEQDRIKELVKQQSALGSQTMRSNIFKCLRDLSHSTCQVFNIDRMPGTERHIHFRDCIYDAATGETMDYMPEAYASRKLHYDCPTKEPAKTSELRRIISEIFPDEYEREAYLMSHAYGLTGLTSWEQHTNANGLPRAGKSLITNDLVPAAFGIYHMAFPSNIFSWKFAGRRKKYFVTALSSPARFGTIEEMETKFIDEAVFKAWTSGGTLSVDKDHDAESLSNTSMVSFFSLTNEPLDLANIRGITSNRLNSLKERIAFFSMRSRFVPAEEVENEKAKGDAECVFVKDTSLKDKFAKNVAYHEAFAWLMMEAWAKLREANWVKPDYAPLNEVLEEHLNDNAVADPTQIWLQESYTPSKEEWIALETLIGEQDDKTMTKARMRMAVQKAFGFQVPDAGPIFDAKKRVGGKRGAVRLASRGGGWKMLPEE